jgi:hypothetical protein
MVLGAGAEGVWCGAVAAAVTGSSWAALTVFATCAVAAAAVVSGRSGGREDAGSGGRWLLLLLLVATGVLLVAGRGWARDYLLWQIVRDVAFTSSLVYLGIRLGGNMQAPESAVRRAARAFALVCVTLVVSAAAGLTPGWATTALVASLVVGGLLIAVVRYLALTDVVADADRLPAVPWLLAITGAVVAMVAISALASQLLTVDVLRWLLGVAGTVLRDALDVLAWLIGWAGAGLLRALDWLLGIFHVNGPDVDWTPPSAPQVQEVVPKQHIVAHGSSMARLVATAAVALAVVTASLGVVLIALRRLRRRETPERLVIEEREALGSLRTTTAAFAGGLGRRLRRGLTRLGPHASRSPAELVRLRYAQLERRLTAAGKSRRPGATVREYLAAAAAESSSQASPSEPAVDITSGASVFVAAGTSAADLAALYELARYSAQAVDAVQAARFEGLARSFPA